MYEDPVIFNLLLASHDILPALLSVELHHETPLVVVSILFQRRPILIHMDGGVRVPELLEVRLRHIPLV